MSPDLTEAMLRGESAQRGPASWWTAALIAGALVVAACGGGGETSDGPDPTGPTTTPTTAAVRTSAPPTTVATTSPPTDPPATDPPVTEPSPTTLDPAALEDQIRADFGRTWAGYNDCGIAPDACDFRAVAVPGSEVDRTLRSFVDDLLTNNLRVGRNSGPATVEVISVAVVDSDTADVTACATDGLVLFDIADPANPDDDIVLNDAVNSYLGVWRMAEVDGQWLRVVILDLDRFAGQQTCDL